MESLLAKRLKRITYKTLPVYLALVLLVYLAQPQIEWLLPGLFLVVAGEGIRIWGVGHLRKTKEVTTSGPYAYVKNPLYLGTLFILVGFCFMAVNFWLLAVGLGIFFLYYAPFKKKREGDRLLEKFGSEWVDYDQAVPDYFPRVSPYPKRGRRLWEIDGFVQNSEGGTLLAVLVGIIVLFLRFFY